MGEFKEVLIPVDLYERAEKWVKNNGGFSSVDDLVKFLIEEFIADESTDMVYTPEEEEEIKSRLKRLGYI